MITHSKTKHRVPGVVCEGGVVLSPHECLQRLRHDQFNLSRRAGSSPFCGNNWTWLLSLLPVVPERQVRDDEPRRQPCALGFERDASAGPALLRQQRKTRSPALIEERQVPRDWIRGLLLDCSCSFCWSPHASFACWRGRSAAGPFH